MRKLAFFGLVAMMICLFAVPTWANDDGAKGSLKKYGKLAAKWWQWAEEPYPPPILPPVEGPSGPTDCSLGQKGKIWFLAGTYGTTVVRDCIDPIPRGKSLFFPLVNAYTDNDDCINLEIDTEDCTVQLKREQVDSLFSYSTMSLLEAYYFGEGHDSYACQMSVTVDGKPVHHKYPIIRIQSPPFKLPDEPGNITDGFWVLVPPLPKGDHTIQFTGGLCEDNLGPLFTPDVTYNFTVGSTDNYDDDD